MSDKPLVQQALASELAELVLTITSNIASIAFLRGFWHTLVREWSGIDQLRCVAVLRISSMVNGDCRLDKYYMLVRRFVNASFRLLARAKWDTALCREYNDILTNPGGPLW
jgi:ribosomal RNA-processing protein 1